MAKRIMIQGTMSSVGKSLLVTGLCRLFRQDGYRVAPFKSQNMSSHCFFTDDGLVMSAAQAVQAYAAGLSPSVLMNPILLKPLTAKGSHLYVNGESRGRQCPAEYFEYRKTLVVDIMRAFTSLSAQNDIIVIEGAGSPAEINLRENDIVNMGLAQMTDSPVLLVADIDCGGVFAQLVGTLALLDDAERRRVKGTIVNKFRGEVEIFRPAIALLEERCGKPLLGVLPYLPVDINKIEGSICGPRVKSAAGGEDLRAQTAFHERQYDNLAAALRKHLDLELIYNIMEAEA
jgi:adenosylcobyric acid synthase